MAHQKKKIMLVFGTRPEAIKMCPVACELNKRSGFQTVICVTGQHDQMLKQALDCFHMQPDYNLAVMQPNQTLFDITSNIFSRLKQVLEKERPDLILVHGDTTSTFVAALMGFYMHIPVGHVEAGLRTYDLDAPFPEEFNRQAVGLVAKFNFAPTKWAADNLLRERKDPATVFVTGNTVIDALKTTVRADYSHPELTWAADSKMILMTAHRRENWGEPMRHIFLAIRKILDAREDVKVIYPIHSNPKIRTMAGEILSSHPRIHLIEPLDVVAFHNFLSRCYLVLTDSGGLQEEAPFLKKPLLLLRNTTERPEGTEDGCVRMVGTDVERIYHETLRLLEDPQEYASMQGTDALFGDGSASEQIADILEKAF